MEGGGWSPPSSTLCPPPSSVLALGSATMRIQEMTMLYYVGMVLAGIGAATLIGALTYVTLMLTGVIMSMMAFTAGPLLDKVFKEK
jgi:hypothetical protein